MIKLMRSYRFWGVLTAAAVLLAGWAWQGGNDARLAPQQELDDSSSGLAVSASATESDPQADHVVFHTGVENLPASLRGTEVDGVFSVDENGHLIATRSIRNIFDYFLSTLGEEPLEVIVARIRAYIHDRLTQPAAGEAEVILNGYLAYRQGLQDLQQAPQPQQGQFDIYAIQAQKAEVAALRSQYLAADVVDAFFADEDAYDRYTLGRLEVMQNEDLTAQQRAVRLDALHQQLPEPLRQSLETANQYQNLQVADQACLEQGCSAQELRQVRAQIVGPEAADRLALLDQEEADWQQRLSSWYEQRSRILDNASLSEADRLLAVERERAALFADNEQIRVKALEGLRDAGVDLQDGSG